ncbi:MAG: hypothetical protein ABI741_10120 [Ferruginibacter sp.]
MTTGQLLIIICFSAFTGWLISWLNIKILFQPIMPIKFMGFKLQGLLPARQASLADKIGSQVQLAFLEYKGLDERLADPALLAKLKPGIEGHVDHFLKEKLKAVFPILAQFMGEKTISQFKNAFLTEIDTLLPVLIRNYMNDLKNELRLDQLVSKEINALSMGRLQDIFYSNNRKEIMYFKLGCTGIGLLTGIITALLLLLVNV